MNEIGRLTLYIYVGGGEEVLIEKNNPRASMLFSSMSATVIRNSSGRIHTDVINILT
jgi:hypothetical protein